MAAGNTTIQKPREQWSKEEKRLVQYNLKAKNIITSALGLEVDNMKGKHICEI